MAIANEAERDAIMEKVKENKHVKGKKEETRESNIRFLVLFIFAAY